MASGEIFQEKNLLVAHKKLPLGSWVEIQNPATGKMLTVPVLDRGPYIAKRDFDLSEGAAKHLGIKSQGVAQLVFRVVSVPQ